MKYMKLIIEISKLSLIKSLIQFCRQVIFKTLVLICTHIQFILQHIAFNFYYTLCGNSFRIVFNVNCIECKSIVYELLQFISFSSATDLSTYQKNFFIFKRNKSCVPKNSLPVFLCIIFILGFLIKVNRIFKFIRFKFPDLV